MNRIYALLPKLLLALACMQALVVAAQTRYWVGGNGAWTDPAHWSERPGGTGGAGVPRVGEDVVIAAARPLTITLDGTAWCRSLAVDAGAASVRFTGGAGAVMDIAGAWSSRGDVRWEGAWPVRLSVRRQGVEVDLRGAHIEGDVILAGNGSWSVISDMAIGGALRVEQGTFIANAARITARRVLEGASARGSIIAGRSVWMLDEMPPQRVLRGILQPASTLVVGGVVQQAPEAGSAWDRDINVCGTNPGQTPFTADARLVTNYNGYGVRCRGECNATVTVTVTGGSGNFTYAWLNGGPHTATWTTACGGPQLVVVTDVTQGVSCPVLVNVTEPAPLGVIFFGQGTPPSCADACDGTRTALAVGGVTPHTYNWNNGAGTNSSFAQLCAGLNTLQIRDANQCTFDTTFFYNVQPIIPNLTFTDANCFGECDGTASVAPSGGSGTFVITWTPAPPVQGAMSVNDLCAGNYSVRIADANGCDTTITFAITQPPSIDVSLTSMPATCAGSCDGTATVAASGTAGPYSYVWTPQPGGGQGTEMATGLCAGTHTVRITDVASGCDTLITVIITAPPAFDVQGTVTDATCADACNGSIGINVSGGTPGYTFMWSPQPPVGQGTGTISGLCPGDWRVTVTDAAGCDTTITYTVNAPPPVLALLSTVDVTCAGACDGRAGLDVSGGTPGYTYTWTPAPGGGQGTPNATGLCAGGYTVRVADTRGCDTTLTFTINEPLPLTATSTQTNVTCGSLCDGTVSVVVSGGVAGYTYLWTPAPGAGQGTPDATGFCAGPVSVLVTDANGCTLILPFVIEEAVPMQLSLQLTPASCPGVCDGTAGVIVAGGVGGYTYAWSPAPSGGQGTASATGLCPQAYSLTVTDAVGCDTTISFTITAPQPIEPNATQTDVTCAGECDGTIALAPTGGNGTFTYLWTPTPQSGQNTATASQLCAGNWSVTITSGGCDTTITFTIVEPLPITVDLLTNDASCPGVCDGIASANASGGTGALTYSWFPEPGAGQGTAAVSGLCPGPHTLTVTDASGCDTTLTFTINEPDPIFVLQSQTDLTCGGTCDGTASVDVTGGAGGFVYAWTPEPVTGQGTPNATGFCVGPVSVLIIDANGCSVTSQFDIQEASPLLLSLQLTPASCSGTCDGTAGVIATGGVPGYTYAWSPEPGAGQGTAAATGLCPQAYDLTVTDAGGCDTTIAFTITAPPSIVPNATQTDATCAGDCDGSIRLAPTGGNGTFTYLWTPAPPAGQNTATASQLCAGDWSVTITSSGCDTTIMFTIVAPLPITVDLVTTDVTCAGECDGTATASASGGTGAFTYLWNPAPVAGQGTSSVSGLCPGPYTLTVTDAAGCDSTIAFVINEPLPITAAITTTSETCAGPCTGTATVAPTGGTGNIAINWQPAPGGGQGTLTATGLCAGTSYTVTLTDDNGCTTSQPFSIDPSAVIIPNSSSTPVTCYGLCDGTATVGPTGGTAPYTYQWSPPPPIGQHMSSVAGLCPGVVQVTITDALGCSIVADILITEPPPLITDAVINDPRCAGVCDGSIVLSTTGGGAGYAYSWSPQPPMGQGTGTISGLCDGTWNVTITDGAGCSQTASYTITPPVPLTLSVSTTPSQCQVCIGSATALFDGGGGLLSIVWTDINGAVVGGSDHITDLCAGLYTATVTDANGCSISQVVAVSDSDGEVLTVADGTTTCPNTCDGTVSVAYTCSDPACLIAWSDADGNVLATGVDMLAGLCPGAYYVAVTNASGCITIDTAFVVEPVVVTLNISSSPVSCTGGCDGTATVGIVDGRPPFTFSWDPEPQGGGQGTPHVTGLCAGVYEVTVGDGAGCETVAEVLITEPQPLAFFHSIVISTSCAGSCDGNITLAVTGGTGSYTYHWSPAPMSGQGGSAAFGFCAGNVEVTVTDDNGCSLQRTFTITSPQALVVSATSTQSTCPNCDGTATATVTGGTGGYTHSWMLGATEVSTDQTATGLCGGIYTLTVRDDYGCSTQTTVQVSDTDAEVLDVVDGTTLCANACDGEVSVNFTCSVGPCTIQWTDVDGNALGQDAQLTGLCTGIYTVQVTNGAGCVSIATATVGTSTTILPNLSTSPVSCAGACDGTATVGPTGGVAPYTYVWTPEPGAGQGTPQATGLCAGVYEVLIADATGCEATVQVLILGPTPIAVTPVIANARCFGACDGSIVVTATGGTGAHTFTWDPVPPNGQGSNGAFDLCAGTYELTIADANGCAAVFSYTITEPAELALAGASVDSECGLCNGEASVTVNGGTDPYVYLWTLGGAIQGTGDTLGNVCAGLYTVQVTDDAGCTASLLVPVQDLNGEVLSTVADTTSCPGVCDGTAEVLFNCGTPDCTVAWYDASGNDLGLSTEVITAMCGGTYLVTVINGTGCVSIDTAIVAEPDPIIANLSTTPVTCFGDCDGTATVGPTGGVGSYDYLWDPAPSLGQGTPHAEGFCAGQAQVTIIDQAGCSIDVPFLILGPDLLTATADVIPITCHGACDGTIVIAAQGGNGGYTYTWTPVPPNGQGNNAGTNLCAGEWICVVADVNGCETTVTVVLDDPALLEATINTTDNSCFAQCEGTAALQITGGVMPYSITWTDASGATIASDLTDVEQLCGGTYNARITDDSGCAIDVPFTIAEGTPITANLVFTGETCAGPCDGTAGVAPTGGEAPYTFLWQPGGEDTDQVTGLCAGNHAITITDFLGCDTTVAFTLLPYTPITDNATASDVNCAGACDGSIITDAAGGLGALSYTWAPVPSNGQGDTLATGLCPGTYTLVIADAAGCDSSFTYTITEPPVLELVVNTLTDASCADAADGAIATTAFGGWPSYTFAWTGPAGFTATTEDLTGLAPGDYHLLLTDANNCTIDTTITVGAQVSVVADAGADQQVCSGTSTTLDGSGSSGAVTWSWRDASGAEIGDTPVMDLPPLPPGDHVFTLVVSDGPCTSTAQVMVTWMALPIADAGADRTIFLSETTTLGGTPAGPPGSTFTWSPDSLLNDGSVPNPVARPMTTTWFHLTVAAPNGCVHTDSVLVSIAPTVVIPNGFTPNGDGRNDTWQIDFIELFPDCVVEVYNRWGEQLFRSVGYNQRWDGRYRDGFVPVGTYYYVIELNDERFPEPYTGPLTVIR